MFSFSGSKICFFLSQSKISWLVLKGMGMFKPNFLGITTWLLNPLSANPIKWSNAIKKFVGQLTTNFLSVFNHFVGSALKGLKCIILNKKNIIKSFFYLDFLLLRFHKSRDSGRWGRPILTPVYHLPASRRFRH